MSAVCDHLLVAIYRMVQLYGHFRHWSMCVRSNAFLVDVCFDLRT